MASAIGTAAGNPWTFPIIWYWIFHLGSWIMGFGFGGSHLPQDLTIQYIFERPMDVLLPMTIGSLPTYALAWLVSYGLVYRTVAGYRLARMRRIRRRRARERGARQKRPETLEIKT